MRAAEALMHAACAKVGVATANLFPQFTIKGNYGWESSIASQLFTPATKVWSITGGITQPLFNGGSLFAQRRAAIATYDQVGAQYRQTVTAFECCVLPCVPKQIRTLGTNNVQKTLLVEIWF